MSTCSVCSAKAITFLCNSHTDELKSMLTDLPWWIDRLTEAALGQTKLRDPGRRSQRTNAVNGDDEVLPKCTCHHAEHEGQSCEAVDREMVTTTSLELNDAEEVVEVETQEEVATPCPCVEYQPVADQAKMRAQFLAAGGINARASDLLDAVRNTLSTWVRHICETRGVVVPALTKPRLMAMWLKTNVPAIACDEGAGQFFGDIKDLVGDKRDEHSDGAIGKLINRPMPRKTLGPCPTWNERTRRVCGLELTAREDAIETTCPQCLRTHNCNQLQLLLMNDLERRPVPFDKILKANQIQPLDRQVSERTLRWWRQHGKLKPHLYRRPNGRVVFNRHSEDDEPLYLWPDVLRLHTEKNERKAKAG